MSSLQILSVIVCEIIFFTTRLVHVYDASCIHSMILIILTNNPRGTMMGNLRKIVQLAKPQHHGRESTEMMKMNTRKVL
jgi:hypothetical protein